MNIRHNRQTKTLFHVCKKAMLSGYTLIGIFCSSIVWASDCGSSHAVALYNDSLEQVVVSEKLKMLKNAAQICPQTYEIMSELGDTHVKGGQFEQALSTYRQMLMSNSIETQEKRAMIFLKMMYAHDALGNRLEVSSYAQKINQLKMNGMTWQPSLEAMYIKLYDKNKQQLSQKPLAADELAKSLTESKQEHRNFAIVARSNNQDDSFDGSVRLDMDVPFATNQASLSYEAQTTLDQVAIALQGNKNMINTVEIIGHTDVRGDEVYNQDLSERRAQAVTRYLSQKLPQMQHQFKPIGMGESQPISSAMTDNAHALNRRVAFRIR